MPRKITYAETGVDRDLRLESKESLRLLNETYAFLGSGNIVELPYGKVFSFSPGSYLDFQIEGVGTKVLLAQLSGKHDTIGIDAVAMAVNDIIRSGAKPIALVDNIHAERSDPELVNSWIKGIIAGANQAKCVVPAGEIGDVADIVQGIAEGKGFDMIIAALGTVSKEKLITGKDVKPGDSVIGLQSSGVHSNGISLVRRLLFKSWGGKYEADDAPEGFDRKLVLEVLEPTRIYVQPFLRLSNSIRVKAAVHITGDAYLKFRNITKFSKRIGFLFDNFHPQPIFQFIQKTAADLKRRISDAEMFKTFNMGWGFAVIVNISDRDRALGLLEKSGVQAEQIGTVTRNETIKIVYQKRKLTLGRASA